MHPKLGYGQLLAQDQKKHPELLRFKIIPQSKEHCQFADTTTHVHLLLNWPSLPHFDYSSTFRDPYWFHASIYKDQAI